MSNECHICKTTEKELRPYGPRGEWVCFPCGTKPENLETTANSFYSQLDACGNSAIIGLEEGPIPFGKQQLNG
jgi:hypothetical protein